MAALGQRLILGGRNALGLILAALDIGFQGRCQFCLLALLGVVLGGGRFFAHVFDIVLCLRGVKRFGAKILHRRCHYGKAASRLRPKR
jgi:hypothetical protein